MRLVSYRVNSAEGWRAGVELDGRVVAVVDNASGVTVRALLEAGPAAVEGALARAQRVVEQEGMPLESLEIGPPLPDPDKILCLGLNYAEHAAESKMELPKAPIIFAKFRNSLIGPNHPIILPRISTEIDYEVELAVVIGRTCKDVAERDALAYVAGYSALNDVSARDLQFLAGQWTPGKAIDTFAPMGPGIVPASEIPDPQNLTLITRVNGQVLQQGNTRHMIFSIASTIAFISSFMTLVPGDIISTGTPDGVGFSRKPPIYLKDGDIVEIEIERIGIMRNPVIGAL